MTRSTETFGDLTPSSDTSPRCKPSTFQLGRLKFGKVQEGKESATKKSTSYSSLPSWVVCCFASSSCSKASLSNSLTQVLVSSSSSNFRHSLLPWCVARALLRCTFLPLLDLSELEPSKLEGCWFAPWRSVGARCQVAKCLSTPCQFCAILSHSLTV